MQLPRIAITPGEPAGIGPDITLKILQQQWPSELILIADPTLLIARSKLLNLPCNIILFNENDSPTAHSPGTAKIVPVSLNSPSQPGILNPKNAAYVLSTLEIATDLCLQKITQALVTGPVQKSVLNDAGIPFSGHTEFLAERCQRNEPIMLFVTQHAKVALLTTHLPLIKVPAAINKNKIKTMLRILYQELKEKFGMPEPKIAVTGLNPHAGEKGHLGIEEIEIISPAMQELAEEGISTLGPLPADTIFTERYLKTVDAILAMYHDQALPVVKYMSFGHAVNVTLGLPIIRTSVDHGTALDMAGKSQTDPGSMQAALQLAIELIARGEADYAG